MEKNNKHNRYMTILAVLVALIAGGLIGSRLTAETSRSVAGTDRTIPIAIATTRTEQSSSQVTSGMGFAEVAKSALPAVVNISSSRIIRSTENGPGSPFFNDPFFRRFFGEDFGPQFNVPQERRQQSLGSGVIVSPDGYIITNSHVVEGAEKVKILLEDRRELEAEVVGADEKTDIAVIKVDEKNLPVLPMGDSSEVQVGDIALAIGNPFGIGQTLTMGIISATGRGNLGLEDYEDFIQTDAAINPGNSGGALINTQGNLIGINTAIISSGAQGNQGIGFAVPVNMARQVMEQILKHGKVIRGWLGVSVQDVTPSIAKAFGLREARGALVADLTPNSPAAKSGIEKGDIILEVGGEQVDDKSDVALKVGQTEPGASLSVKLFRDGREQDVSVTLGELSDEPQRASLGSPKQGGLEGLAVEEITPQIARELGLPARTRGVVVTSVQSGSKAGMAGLRRGDIIQEVNKKAVASVPEFSRALQQARGETVLLLVNRGGSTIFVAVESE